MNLRLTKILCVRILFTLTVYETSVSPGAYISRIIYFNQ